MCPCRRDFVRDFLVGVVGRPAVLAGNSIGGFISASCAADYPELVAGLALVNTYVRGPGRGGCRDAKVPPMLHSSNVRAQLEVAVEHIRWQLHCIVQLACSIAHFEVGYLKTAFPVDVFAWCGHLCCGGQL
jgi:pimeloyl-ACP methyl ester carboxylesterase